MGVEVAGVAGAGAEQGAAAHADGPGLAAQPPEPPGGADDQGGRAVADRGAHGAGEGEDDGLVGQHLLCRHRGTVLAARIVRGGGVVLGGQPGEVLLRRAEAGHVGAGLGGIEVHEQAAALGRFLAAHGADVVEHPIAVMDVGPAGEGRGDPVRPVGKDHLLGPDDEGDVARSGAQPVQGLKQGGGAGSAGVLDIDDRDAGQAEGAQGDLAAHRVLAFQHGLTGVGEPGRLNVVDRRARIAQGGGDRFGGQRFDAVVRPLAEGGHGGAGDEDVLGQRGAHAMGRRRCTMRNREATKARSARQALPAGFRPVT